MAIQFPNNNAAYYDAANWLDNIDSLSWCGWVRVDNLRVPAADQTIWGHRGAVDRMQFFRDDGGEIWFAVTAGGVYDRVEDTITCVEDTLYHFAVTWEKNSATGLKLYRNGAYITSASTTDQPNNYQSGGTVDLFLGCYSNDNSFGQCTGEGWCWWTGTVLDADQIAALYWVGWPHLVNVPPPAAFYPLNDALLTRFPDWSGNSRHIESSTIDTGVLAAGRIGKWEDPHGAPSARYRQPGAGVTPPNTWTLFETVNHPTTTSVVTGLTNGTTYEFSLTALDTSGNESVRSNIIEATPLALAAVHTPKPAFLWHQLTKQFAAASVATVTATALAAEAELIPAPSYQNMIGFESAHDYEAPLITGHTFDSTVKHSGAYSLRFNLTGSNTGWCELSGMDPDGSDTTPFNAATIYLKTDFLMRASPGSASEQCIVFRDIGGTDKAELRINSTRYLELYDKNTTLVDTANDFLWFESWTRIEVKIGTGASAPYEVKLDGMSVMSGTADFGTNNNGYILLGRRNNRNSQDIDYNFDDVIIDDAHYPGDVIILPMFPDGNGNYTGWTASTGTKYGCIDEVPVNDATDYIYTSTSSDAYTATLQSAAAAGITGDIRGVKALVHAMQVSILSTPRLYVRLRSGSTDSDTTGTYIDDAKWYSWGKILHQDPATSATWTLGGLDGAEVGCVKGTTGVELRTTHARLDVAVKQ